MAMSMISSRYSWDNQLCIFTQDTHQSWYRNLLSVASYCNQQPDSYRAAFNFPETSTTCVHKLRRWQHIVLRTSHLQAWFSWAMAMSIIGTRYSWDNQLCIFTQDTHHSYYWNLLFQTRSHAISINNHCAQQFSRNKYNLCSQPTVLVAHSTHIALGASYLQGYGDEHHQRFEI